MEAVDFHFRFKSLNRKGQPQGFGSKRGYFDGELLTLDDAKIPAAVLVHVENRDNRMLIATVDEKGNTLQSAIILTSGSAERLKRLIGISRSSFWAAHSEKELREKGMGHTFRSATCPRCTATIELTGLPTSQQLYCRFCDTVSTTGEAIAVPPDEHKYRLCDECGMYSKPRRFTIFYFYFLLIVYGFHSKQTWRCPACMRPEAWKMVFGNALFILGLPTAIIQLTRSYGSDAMSGAFNGLDKANILAQKGDLDGAVEAYRPILKRLPATAGVKYNLGLALYRQRKVEEAADAFELSLMDCSNYVPAFNALRMCYAELGQIEKQRSLEKQWGLDEPQKDPDVSEPEQQT